MDYKTALDYLSSFTRAGAPVKDLSRFSALMRRLGDPQEGMSFIHVAGTNGKGSVCEFISESLEKAGFLTGKFTSPYITCIEERIQLNGTPVPPNEFAALIGRVKAAAEETNRSDYSQFELLTGAAFLYYAEKGCDHVVLETGIGGRLDCTNIIDPVISVITTVDLDHCDILGNTPAEIATHKAGIIKKSRPVVLSPRQYPEVISVVRQRAEETGSRLILPDDKDLEIRNVSLEGTRFAYKNKDFFTGMCGEHQALNAAAAIEALRFLGVGEEEIACGLKTARVPARMERIGNWLIDGAHNVSGAKAAARLIGGQSGKKLLLTGMLRSKDWQGALTRLIPLFDSVIAVDGFAEGAVNAADIAGLAEKLGVRCDIKGNVEEAAKAADMSEAEMKVVCGSLYLCGKVRNELTM